MADARAAPPLDGVRVIAVEQYGAGPWATLQLSDLGAEVIKIEDPASGGDVGRYVPPYQDGEDSLFFETFNRGKLSISLDLRSDAGRAVIACAKEHFWRALCVALERPDLLEDERFTGFAARLAHRKPLVAILSAELARRPAREWIELLASAGVPCAVVNDVSVALADPQVEARGSLVEIDHPHLGTVRQVASPLRVDGARRTYERAPLRDEHRTDVLRRVCGYDDEAIDTCARDGGRLASSPSAASRCV